MSRKPGQQEPEAVHEVILIVLQHSTVDETQVDELTTAQLVIVGRSLDSYESLLEMFRDEAVVELAVLDQLQILSHLTGLDWLLESPYAYVLVPIRIVEAFTHEVDTGSCISFWPVMIAGYLQELLLSSDVVYHGHHCVTTCDASHVEGVSVLALRSGSEYVTSSQFSPPHYWSNLSNPSEQRRRYY